MSTVLVGSFPVTNDTPLKGRGAHFDIPYEISNHGRRDDDYRGMNGTWCYYVSVSELMLISPEDFESFWLAPEMSERAGRMEPHYRYFNARFADAEWHGGVTFYEKTGGIDGAARAVRIGCDFAHYWDEGHEFDYEHVEFEARRTVEALRDMYLFRRRCSWSGRWLPAEELETDKHGRLYSPIAKAESDAKLAAIQTGQ